MAWSAIDEAVRNAVAVGADPDRLAILDNFCLGDPRRPETMWALLEAARGCRDASIAHRAPFISGKDSFNNEYLSPDGERKSIPPSLLVSAIALVPEAERAITSFLKKPGDPIYLVGEFEPTLAGSHWALVSGMDGASVAIDGPPVPPGAASRLYRALHRSMRSGAVKACHDLSEGGLAVAIAEMCMGGRLGAELALPSTARVAGGSREASPPSGARAASDAGGPGAAGGPPPPELLLFGETNGCLLVEVDASRAAEFEAALAGLPLEKLGETKAERRLAFLEGGRVVLGLRLDEMIGAWKGAA
jgi:phosphoribosylformylglycinamidine (FGAM) synthase-like enzyme